MKRILVALGLVLVVVGAAGGGLWYFLSQFDARAEIMKRVSVATGRAFEIRGPVSVSLWPVIGFRGDDVTLANTPGGKAPHLLEARELTVGVALKPLMDKRLEITGVTLTEPRLALEVDGAGRPNWILAPTPAPAPSAPQAPASPNGKKPEPGRGLQEISLTSASLTKGVVTYTNARSGSSFELSDLSFNTALKGLDQPLTISGDATYRKEAMTFDLTLGKFRALLTGSATPLTLKVTSAPLKAAFTGAFDVKTGGLTGGVSADGPSLRNFFTWMGAPLGEGKTFQAFQISGNIAVGPKRYTFENASFQIDDVKARGDFLFEQTQATPLLSGRLEILAIDLNPYLAPPAPKAGEVQIATLQPVDVTAPAGWSEAPMRLEGLKQLNANLDLTTGPLTINKVRIDRSKMGLVLNDGYLASTLSELDMYGGKGSGRFELNAKTPSVTIRNELAVQNIDAKAFFTDAIGFENIEGTAKLDWSFTGVGSTQKDMMNSLSGDGQIAFSQGALRGVDLGGVARTIRNAMRRELVSPKARTAFSNFSAAFRAKDGVIATNTLELDATDAKLTAVGTIDAGKRRMDMRLVPRLGAMALAVPFRVNGPWDALAYSSDILGRARPEIEAKARVVLGR